MMLRKIIIFAFFTFLPFIALAQNSTSALIEGKVIDNNGKPVGTNMIFLSSEGKRFMCKSNSNDGAFQQALTPGENYTIVFKDYTLVGENSIRLTESKEYKEYKRELKVKKIEKGSEIIHIKAFEPGKTDLLKSINGYLNTIKAFIDLNKTTKIEIYISGSDSKFSSSQKTAEVKTKKGSTTKKVKYSEKDQQRDLVLSRVGSIKQYFEGLGMYFAGDVFKEDTKMTTTDNKKKSKTVSSPLENLRVLVK